MVKTAVRRPGNPTVSLIVAQTPLAGSKRPLILTAARIGRRPRLPYTRPTDASAAGRFRGVAQWLARLLWEQKVAGSSPVAPTDVGLVGRSDAFIHGPATVASQKSANSRACTDRTT